MGDIEDCTEEFGDSGDVGDSCPPLRCRAGPSPAGAVAISGDAFAECPVFVSVWCLPILLAKIVLPALRDRLLGLELFTIGSIISC